MRRLCIIFILAVWGAVFIQAEEPEPVSVSPNQDSPLQDFFPRFRGRALVLDIHARIVEPDQTVIWDETHQQNTILGRPVGIKMVGSNIVVAAQFTPYIRHRGTRKFLVAQGQVWMEVPGQGIRYYTSMQTIPLEFGEPIYFFPLGPQTDDDSARIEVMLTLYPYENKE